MKSLTTFALMFTILTGHMARSEQLACPGSKEALQAVVAYHPEIHFTLLNDSNYNDYYLHYDYKLSEDSQEIIVFYDCTNIGSFFWEGTC